jgi:OOP family OmpA-OmpF porin
MPKRPAFPWSIVGALAATVALAPAARAADDAPLQPVKVRAVARFGFDKTNLRADDRDKILAEVGRMADVSWQSITATGYTDSRGSATYNEQLSARRAEAVKSYLVGKGIDASMIATTGKAAADPVASNESPSGRAQNRRTEIEFKGVRTAAK